MLEFLFLLEHVVPDDKSWIVQFSDNIWKFSDFWSTFITVVLAVLLLIGLIIIFIRIWDRRVIPWAIKYVLPWLEKIREDFSTEDSSYNPDSVDDVQLGNNNPKTKIEKLGLENSQLELENSQLKLENSQLKRENSQLKKKEIENSEPKQQSTDKNRDTQASPYSQHYNPPTSCKTSIVFFKTNTENKFTKAYEDDSDGMAIFKAQINGDHGTYELIDNGTTGIDRIRWRNGNQYVISYESKNCFLNNAQKFNMENRGIIKRDGDSWLVTKPLEGTFE
jgi:hypothetical protein